MENGILQYILIGTAVSIIVSFVLDQLKKLIQVLKDRRSRRNMGSPASASGHSASRMIAPPDLPGVRPNIQMTGTVLRGRGGENVTRRSSRRRPPDLPQRSAGNRMPVESFPRCPIHRCGNRQGEQQKIFWDAARRQWKCYRNHYFSS